MLLSGMEIEAKTGYGDGESVFTRTSSLMKQTDVMRDHV